MCCCCLLIPTRWCASTGESLTYYSHFSWIIIIQSYAQNNHHCIYSVFVQIAVQYALQCKHSIQFDRKSYSESLNILQFWILSRHELSRMIMESKGAGDVSLLLVLKTEIELLSALQYYVNEIRVFSLLLFSKSSFKH